MRKKKISEETRDELVGAIGARYRAASKAMKLQILGEFVAVTGYHRKHAIRVLNDRAPRKSTKRSRVRVYDEAFRQGLIVLWEASDRVCGKRLKALLPVLIAALERHGHLKLDEGVRTNLLTASAATIDRNLREPRAGNSRRRRQASAASGVRRAVPVRTFGDWKEPPPGFLEADLVAHCGESMEGSFVHTLALTDIASGWTECAPLLVREGTLVVEALTRLRTAMPFPLHGFDTDNGSEFLNEIVLDFCKRERIEFTRSRAYHKNDQAWIEQKNGSVVRRMIGYRRLEGLAAVRVLTQLYAAARLFVNFFQPSFKLIEKTRVGARVRKRYLPPETPCARLLRSDAVPNDVKERLRRAMTALDPLKLLDQIRSTQHELADLAAGRVRACQFVATKISIASSRASRQPGAMARFDPRTARTRSRRGTGERTRTRSRMFGLRYSHGSNRSRIGLRRNCSSSCKTGTREPSAIASCEHFSDA